MSIFRKKSAKNKARIYLDYAASTPVDRRVVKAMEPYWSQVYGNPGSHHKEGLDAKSAIDSARKECANFLKTQSENIIFTGSGTESNNIAIFGTIGELVKRGTELKDMHVITSRIEHPSVLDCFKNLEKRGVNVSYIDCDRDGIVDVRQLEKLIKDNTVLISIMYVNNEMGAIEPIEKIGKIISKRRGSRSTPYFHTDASQAGLYIPIDVNKLRVDMLTLDAQKMYGPKGVGLLYKSSDLSLTQVLVGGSQEFSIRPSTENVPLIIGFAKAYELAITNQKNERTRLANLRDYTIDRILKEVEGVELNGPLGDRRAVNNINFSIKGIEGEYATVTLSQHGIAVGSRSACISDAGGPSYVIEAMGKHDLASNSVRISLGNTTTKKDIITFMDKLKHVTKHRSD